MIIKKQFIKPTLNAEQTLKNLYHNAKLLDDNIRLKEITGEFDDNWQTMVRLQQMIFQEIGQWEFIKRNQ